MDDTRGGPAGTSKVVDNRVGERRHAPVSSVLPEGVEGSELWRRRCLHPWRRTEHHGSFGHLIPPGGRSRHLCQIRSRLVGQRLQGALPCHIRAGLVGTTGNGPNPVIYDAHSSLAQLSRQQRTRFVSVVVGGALQPVCQAARAQAPDLSAVRRHRAMPEPPGPRTSFVSVSVHRTAAFASTLPRLTLRRRARRVPANHICGCDRDEYSS